MLCYDRLSLLTSEIECFIFHVLSGHLGIPFVKCQFK